MQVQKGSVFGQLHSSSLSGTVLLYSSALSPLCPPSSITLSFSLSTSVSPAVSSEGDIYTMPLQTGRGNKHTNIFLIEIFFL